MKGIEKLASYFQKFPGIGPRQAKRFVYFLLTQEKGVLEEIARLVKELKDKTVECNHCHRFFEADGYAEACDICGSPNRDAHLLMIVEKDADLEAIEKSGVYNGRYFVLGGTVSLLDGTPKTLRVEDLLSRVRDTNGGLTEIILATGAHPEGEMTADHVRTLLSHLLDKQKFTLTLLGRGLSTGTELEYSDRETIRNALINRR